MVSAELYAVRDGEKQAGSSGSGLTVCQIGKGISIPVCRCVWFLKRAGQQDHFAAAFDQRDFPIKVVGESAEISGVRNAPEWLRRNRP